MRYALVDQRGFVANVIEANADFQPAEGAVKILAEAPVAGGWRWTGTDFAPPENPPGEAPVSVSDLQFRLALNALGLREAVETLVANGPQAIRDYWDRALTIRRESELVIASAMSLGKSEQDLDDLFSLAANF